MCFGAKAKSLWEKARALDEGGGGGLGEDGAAHSFIKSISLLFVGDDIAGPPPLALAPPLSPLFLFFSAPGNLLAW